MVHSNKSNMETTNRQLDRKNMMLLFLMSIFIILLMVMIVTLIKNKDVIMIDPIHYGMKENKFHSCICYGVGTKIEFDNVSAKISYDLKDLNGQELNFSLVKEK